MNHNDENLSEVHFENLFPHEKVHDKLIDECNSYRRSSHLSTFEKDKIALCDPEHNDLDCLVKICCLMTIVAFSEVQCGA